jgi:hypothetical protein
MWFAVTRRAAHHTARTRSDDEIPLLSMLICLFNDAGWGEFCVIIASLCGLWSPASIPLLLYGCVQIYFVRDHKLQILSLVAMVADNLLLESGIRKLTDADFLIKEKEITLHVK